VDVRNTGAPVEWRRRAVETLKNLKRGLRGSETVAELEGTVGERKARKASGGC
jgi:hypothetical protein